MFTAQGRTVDAGYLLVDESMTRDLAYVGGTRGRERNVMLVKTGPPDPAAPSQPDRERAERARLEAAHELLKRGDTEAALKAFEPGPEPEPTWQMAPWEAVMAKVLAKDDPLGTALEQMKAAQDYPTNIGHLITISEAFWWADVVPQIDQAIQGRLSPAEAARYMSDPERPALLQLIREHELGGRPVAESVEMITARSMQGAHSIAAVLHGRLEKAAPPARGRTETFAERVPGGAAPQIDEVYQAADARQAEIGRELAERPPAWALEAWGVPPAHQESAARRADWEKQAGIVGAYREAAGITDPDVTIGPAPAGKGVLREMFSATVRALELPDERALMAAMGNEDLEARLVERERAVAVAPPDVSESLASVERQRDVAAKQAEQAAEASDRPLARSAEALAAIHDGQLASLRVADAARREWAEAHAPLEASAKAAARELRARHLEERIPVTDAEVAEAAAQERPFPVIDPAEAARWRAEQTAQLEADRQARAEAAAQRTPVTDAEIARYSAEAEPEPRAEIREALTDLDARVDELAQQEAERAERRAEMAQAAIDEPVVREPQAEPSLESSWQPGSVPGRYEPEAVSDYEPEMGL